MTACHIVNHACYTALCRAWRWLSEKVKAFSAVIFVAAISVGGIVPAEPVAAAQPVRQKAFLFFAVCPTDTKPVPKFSYVLYAPSTFGDVITVTDTKGNQRECLWLPRKLDATI